MDPTQNSSQGAAPSGPATSSSSSPSPSLTSAAPSLTSKIAMAHQQVSRMNGNAPAAPVGQMADKAAETQVPAQQAQPAEVKAPVDQDLGKKAPAIVEFDGRRFDFSDPQKVAKKLVDLEKGMRSFQAERDKLKQELTQHEANSPAVENGKRFGEIERKYMAAMKHALGEDGSVRNPRALVAGVDHILGEIVPAEVLNNWLNHKLQMNLHVMNLSPEQREQFMSEYQDRQAIEQQRIQLELDRSEIDGFKSEAAQAKEAQARETLKATITPIRQKYSFSNTIKDPRTAAFLDKQLWFEAKAQMKQVLDQGQELSPAAVENIFKGIKNELTLGQQGAAREAVTSEVAKQKDSAMSGILDAATSGAAPRDEIDEMFKKNARPGDILQARFKNLMGRK